MPFLLFLTGPRVDDVVELNPDATLTLGSSGEAHIQVLDDADVAATHGQIYPAEGSYWFQDLGQAYTYLNLDPLTNATHALRPHDVLIVGRTFLKFVTERPRARAGGGGGRSSREVATHKKEIERLREKVNESKSVAAKARRELAQVRSELEKVRATQRAERASSRQLGVLELEHAELGEEIEAELLELRARASELAAALVVGRSGATTQ